MCKRACFVLFCRIKKRSFNLLCVLDQIFTDGSRADEKVAAAAVSSVAPNGPF